MPEIRPRPFSCLHILSTQPAVSDTTFGAMQGITGGVEPFMTQWLLYVPHSGHYTYRTVVTIRTAQWSLYVSHNGHYTYSTVVTICTEQWLLYVSHNGQYTYSTVVTIRTEQWLLYVSHNGHYTYSTVVTIRTEQWLLYVKHSDYYTYRTVVTIRTARCNIQQFYVLPTQCICVFFVDLGTNGDYFPIQH